MSYRIEAFKKASFCRHFENQVYQNVQKKNIKIPVYLSAHPVFLPNSSSINSKSLSLSYSTSFAGLNSFHSFKFFCLYIVYTGQNSLRFYIKTYSLSQLEWMQWAPDWHAEFFSYMNLISRRYSNKKLEFFLLLIFIDIEESNI